MRTRHLVGVVPLLFGVWFFGTLAPYGVHVDEDGDLLYQMFATFRGQVPYIDFSSGYTPGFFYYHAALFRLFAVDALVVRISVAIANTLSVYLLYLLAARLVQPGLALLAPLLFVGGLLAFPGSFCAFNVPYPAWYNIALWLGSLAAVAAYVDHGRMRALLLAGLLAVGAVGRDLHAVVRRPGDLDHVRIHEAFAGGHAVLGDRPRLISAHDRD
jgi:4-amino-4-deoxy-L-arabinose transferase-like glycosyltransferase